MKEYEILYDTGEARKLVAQISRMAKEGWQAKSIGALGAPTDCSCCLRLDGARSQPRLQVSWIKSALSNLAQFSIVLN